MVTSRSTLSRPAIVEAVTDLLGAAQVNTDEAHLRESSVDRFRKYSAVHGVYDGPFPAAVAYPTSTDEVARLLDLAQRERIAVVARTGGTSTEGGLETVVEDTLVVDGSRMDQILHVDADNMMVTAQCGVPLQLLEDTLRAQGLTTGHSPQSKPIAQLGGLVATRSIGQFSTLYGAIEDMVVGLEAVFPGGVVTRIKNVPRRAAGPDIRHVVIGNEGALAFVTEVTLKVFRWYPDTARYFGFHVPVFADGVGMLREIVTAGYRPSVARLYSPEDARQHFPDHPMDQNLVILSAEGPAPLVAATAQAIEAMAASVGHERVPEEDIRAWFEGLNWGADKIEAEKRSMLETSHLGYTTEVSVDWSRTAELYDAVMHRIRTTFARAADLTLLGAHSSHSYQTGTNLYFVYDYRIACEPREEIDVYHQPLNAIIVEEALRLGGSMVHHHGVGKYRTPWVQEEHGSAYFLLAGLKRAFDPDNVMNPGSVYPIDAEGRAVLAQTGVP
ncbi:FAD-linked oxidoreductase [Nocardioides szechwanensis]|uniref:FAD/FMN-containing dehydrogenase n=1 Tax=Nocardioides szechwanensis TaxID=1005944 RepID=A0A1H0GZY9_9ACTN|nr:FAD-binding oxidoreductase [Nocardioides szechwanensis]GEP34121.1 FAD-linked oxidoreductase [Nocardioides szechwanensis]SDO12251.1 FAD/FMN-containing dehydrogenase [Nocardioides szechwanensis]